MIDPQPPRHHNCAFCGLGRHDCALALATSSAQDHNPLLLAPGQRLGKRILCPLRPMDQGPPCPCSLHCGSQSWPIPTMPPVSTLTVMPHPGSQHLLNTALETVTPAVPWQQPQCALHMSETQDAWPWKCVEPCVWSLGLTCLRDSGHRGARTQAFHQCRGREQKEKMDLASRSPSLHLESSPRGTGNGLSM